MRLESLLPPPLLLVLALVLGACQGEPKPPPPPPGSGEAAASRPLLRDLRWDPIDGAERYELRVWAANRLLFESTQSDTLLELTPVQQRSIAAFDSVRLVVRGLRAGERLEGSKRIYRLGG